MGLVVGGHVDRATVSFDYIVVLVQGRVSLPVWARAAVIFRGVKTKLVSNFVNRPRRRLKVGLIDLSFTGCTFYKGPAIRDKK